MRNNNPVVSIVIAAHNEASFIEEAILSVINQTMSDWELYVIDDCSEDETFRIAEKFASNDERICVLQNEVNLGVAKTRNRGIELSKGRYVAFLDGDDIWLPEKLESQLHKIQKEDAAICYCSYGIIGITGEKVRGDYLVPETACYQDILKENYIQCSAMLIRQDLVKKIMFNTDFFHEDYILGLDILSSGEKAVGCCEILLNWRYFGDSRSFDKKKSAVNRWQIYREYLHLPLYKAAYFFMFYAISGFRKYLKKYDDVSIQEG